MAKAKPKKEAPTPKVQDWLDGVISQRYDPAAPIDSVQPHPRNVNVSDLKAVMESIQATGFHEISPNNIRQVRKPQLLRSSPAVGICYVHESTGQGRDGQPRTSYLVVAYAGTAGKRGFYESYRTAEAPGGVLRGGRMYRVAIRISDVMVFISAEFPPGSANSERSSS